MEGYQGLYRRHNVHDPPYHEIQLEGKFERNADGSYPDLRNENKPGFGHSKLSVDEQAYFVQEVSRNVDMAKREGWRFVLLRFISR